jgi:hypothetical protein
MSGAIPPLPQYAFMAWCLVKKKHRATFTLHVVSTLTLGNEYVLILFMKYSNICKKRLRERERECVRLKH